MVTQFGESFVGESVNAAHLNTVLGVKGGPVEMAWITSLATPAPGLTRFVTVLQPGLPVKPMTLFVPKAAIEGAVHGRMTWGPAQAGVAAGVADALAQGIVAAARADDLLLIAAVWVNPLADDEQAVFANNRDATRRALEAGALGLPPFDDVLAARDAPCNPFFTGPRRSGS